MTELVRHNNRKAVSFIQSGDYFIALCDDGSLWQVLITATDTATCADWSRCAKPILGCRKDGITEGGEEEA